jgi:hypothetical protein
MKQKLPKSNQDLSGQSQQKKENTINMSERAYMKLPNSRWTNQGEGRVFVMSLPKRKSETTSS